LLALLTGASLILSNYFYQQTLIEAAAKKFYFAILLCGFSIACILTMLLAVFKERPFESDKDLKIEEKPKPVRIWSPNEQKILKLEYAQLHNEILTRNQYGWLIISIFAAASFLVSFGVESQVEMLPIRYLISLFFVVFCAISQKYYDSINRTCWDRRREIENLIGIDGPKYRYKKIKQSFWYQIGAYTIWDLLWLFLSITYILFIIISLM
jgi:hypothetical protein